MGGVQEHEVAAWGHEHLESGDLLLDTSWMMQALLLSGSHTVARAPNAYPPGGAAWPAGAWRFTRPWPEEREASGRYFALVNYLAMAPNTFDAKHAPIEDLITGPDTDMGKAIANKPDQGRRSSAPRTPSFASIATAVLGPLHAGRPSEGRCDATEASDYRSKRSIRHVPMDQPPTTPSAAGERTTFVRIDVADVGALWRVVIRS